jgi:hypothetical protein
MNMLFGGQIEGEASPEWKIAYGQLQSLLSQAEELKNLDPQLASAAAVELQPKIESAQQRLDTLSSQSGFTPSLLQRLQENFDFRKDATDTYLDTMTGVDTDFLNSIQGETNTLNQGLGEAKSMITTPSFFLNLGGKNVGAVPGANRNSADLLSRLAETSYNAGINQANTGYQVGSGAAGRELTAAETYAPNTAEIDYFQNNLWPMMMQLQNLRYQTPTTTQTGNVSSTPSFLERLKTFSETVTPAVEQLKTLFTKDEEG